MSVNRKGIDVSTWQGDIDWKKVKADGIEFAMLRSSFGKENIEKQTDNKFHQNYKNAKAAGIPVGAYHYSYAKTVEDAKKEADFFLSVIEGCQFEYPVAFDIEDASQMNLGKKLITDIIMAFCERVQSAGYYVSIYTNLDWLTNRIDMSRAKIFDVWLAQWNDKPTYTGSFGMWQYSAKGTVNGISGSVDMDRAYLDYPEIIKGAGLNGYTKAAENNNCGYEVVAMEKICRRKAESLVEELKNDGYSCAFCREIKS